jgi:cytochrome c oxidase subunit IV
LAIHLLIFGVATTITTLTCLVDMLSWPGYSRREHINLCSLYVPYLVVAVIMTIDAFSRLSGQAHSKVKST